MTSNQAEITTPLQKLEDTRFELAGIEVWMKRDDLNHPLIQGNKWHKLRLNLQQAEQQGQNQLLTFGGAYSNHIAATAAACYERGWPSIGFIRGDELATNHQAWSPTLKQAQLHGMQFEFLDRQTYRLRHHQAWLEALQPRFPNTYLLPEGGSNEFAVAGFEQVINQLNQQCEGWTDLFCAVGTGGSLAGLAKYASINQTIWGVASLKKADYLKPQIQNWIGSSKQNWRLLTEFHGGGYAKSNSEIVLKTKQFESQFQIPLDPIYTAKLVWAFNTLLEQNHFQAGQKIVLYHSGGLQGCAD